MKKRYCVTAAVLVLAASTAFASPKCKPVVGHFQAQVVPPGEPCEGVLCTTGRVWGGIQGEYQFTMSSLVPSGPTGVASIFFFTGKSRIFLKSGDELRGTDTGSIDLPQPPFGGQGGFASLITFDGGTGTMSGATGQIRLRGELSLEDGTTSGDYIGSLCTQ